jgi:hypothetical protein
MRTFGLRTVNDMHTDAVTDGDLSKGFECGIVVFSNGIADNAAVCGVFFRALRW